MSKTDLVLTGLYFLLLLLVVNIGLAMSSQDEEKEKQTVQRIADMEQDKRIEELEKEVRLLKTDLYILHNGFGEEDND